MTSEKSSEKLTETHCADGVAKSIRSTRTRPHAWVAMAAVAALALGAWTTAFAGPSSPSKVDVRTSGSVRVEGGAAASDAGKVIRLADASARATIEFAGGAALDLVGPAVLQIVELSDKGNRVMLVSGVVSEARVGGVALEIQTPYDASLVLQNATGFARVSSRDRVTFQRKDGEYARVHQASAAYDLKSSPWTLNLREPTATGPAPAPEVVRGPAVLEQMSGDRARTRLGSRTVVIEPASKFKKTDLPNGGVRFCFQADGSEFGVVYVGTDTVLFLGNGECVDFDGNGHVTRFDGISHIYHPLDEQLPYDEPVENAADASISRSSRR